MSKPIALAWRSLCILLFLAAAGGVRAAEVIPAKPTRYFNDYANVVSPATGERLNTELETLEKESSNQIVVAVYPTMQTDSAIDDYCLRIFRTWQVGQKATNNGAVLFVFVQNHKLWIQTGRGLEGALPDATCKDIIEDQIDPRFTANDYDGGLTAGVESMIAATKGEYKGSGQTEDEKEHPRGGTSTGGGLSFGAIIFLLIVFFIISRFFGRGGGIGGLAGPILFGGLTGGGGFGGGGGSSGGGGGGFSSGGGDTGGGGAGGSW